MPRSARFAVAGFAWHIVQRGNNRADCFFTQQDYRYYLAVLRDQAKRWRCAIHAYVLMTNHVHLLLTPTSTEGPSQLMKHLGQRYAQHINRRYGRTGTLWEGRYRSCIAERDGFVLACYRYIELNPVRAGMVAEPHLYPWSSHRTNVGSGYDPMIAPHPEYLDLATVDEDRRARYATLVSERLSPGVVESIRRATNRNQVLGSRRSLLASMNKGQSPAQ